MSPSYEVKQKTKKALFDPDCHCYHQLAFRITTAAFLFAVNANDPIASVPLIGPSFAARLNRLNIATISDLLHHYPSRHEDLTLTSVTAEVLSCKSVYTRSRKTIQKAVVKINGQTRELTWFNQPWLASTLKPGLTISLAGDDISPDFELIKPGQPRLHTGRIVPVYPETAGVSSKWLRSRIHFVLKTINELKDNLPAEIKAKYQLIDLFEALKKIHFPDSQTQLAAARKRLAFDELFWLQLQTLYQKRRFKQKKLSRKLTVNQEKVLSLIADLPFELTTAQKRSIKEILADLESVAPMNRLLQGDVGSGKTVVAAISLFVAFENGFKSALMAPTQILASQHFKTLEAVFAGKGIKLQLVTAATKKTALAADILVGTQALLHRQLKGKKLGLVVIDEQHRFGVKQRSQLINEADTTPHLLTMTATPIPRTVALTVYGNLDLSTLDEMPKGRQAIKTYLVPRTKQLDAWRWIDKQIKTKKVQAFIVYPFIDPSGHETLNDVKAARNEYLNLKKIFDRRQIDLIHGRLSAKEKEKVMARFRDKKSQILVATPVIEVGIDIPNAAIMVIENAERFGLAQLHQLRGRVGRSEELGYCLLFVGPGHETAAARLNYLTQLNSGSKLAEIDLKLRGPGNLYGTAQHGFWQLKLADWSDLSLLKITHQAADLTLNQPTPALIEILKQSKIGQIAPN